MPQKSLVYKIEQNDFPRQLETQIQRQFEGSFENSVKKLQSFRFVFCLNKDIRYSSNFFCCCTYFDFCDEVVQGM